MLCQPWFFVYRMTGVFFIFVYGWRERDQQDQIVSVTYLGNKRCRIVLRCGRLECCQLEDNTILTDWLIVLQLRCQSGNRQTVTLVVLPGHPLWGVVVNVLRQVRLAR